MAVILSISLFQCWKIWRPTSRISYKKGAHPKYVFRHSDYLAGNSNFILPCLYVTSVIFPGQKVGLNILLKSSVSLYDRKNEILSHILLAGEGIANICFSWTISTTDDISRQILDFSKVFKKRRCKAKMGENQKLSLNSLDYHFEMCVVPKKIQIFVIFCYTLLYSVILCYTL